MTQQARSYLADAMTALQDAKSANRFEAGYGEFVESIAHVEKHLKRLLIQVA